MASSFNLGRKSKRVTALQPKVVCDYCSRARVEEPPWWWSERRRRRELSDWCKREVVVG